MKNQKFKLPSRRSFRPVALVVSIMAVVFTVCTSSPFVFAADGEESEIPRVIFENENDNKVTFDFSKKVSSNSDGVIVPDDSFAFQVMFGKDADQLLPLGNTCYHKYNEQNQELADFEVELDGTIQTIKDAILSEYDKDPSYKRLEYRSDEDGIVFLKNGQTASFEDLKVNYSYRLVENPDLMIPDETYPEEERGTYIQLTENKEGVFSSKGVKVEFENMYQPPIQDNEKTKVKIFKYIAAPDGFELSKNDMGKFTFRVLLNGEPHSGSYSIYDIESNEWMEDGELNSSGDFVMKGQCFAVFEDVPVGMQLDVYEKCEEDVWWALDIGDHTVDADEEYLDKRSVETAGTDTIVQFRNTKYSLVLTKQLELSEEILNDPELKTKHESAEFTFVISDKDNVGINNLPYYLYDATGDVIGEIHYTSHTGEITLKANQRALVMGIKSGEEFHIVEVNNPLYEQITPSDIGGYQNEVIKNGVKNYTFVNKPKELPGLVVTKYLKDSTGTIDLSKAYSFVLYKKDRVTGEYSIVPRAFYEVQSGTEKLSKKTDENGVFTLAPNETAYFTSLIVGTYALKEINLSLEDFREDSFRVRVNDEKVAGEYREDGDQNTCEYLVSELVLDEGNPIDVGFTNKKHIDYELAQTGSYGTTVISIIGILMMLIGMVVLYIYINKNEIIRR